ncbi:MAG: hypothetical protein DMG70_11185 [Acidobacteria bacterium]|nr:MAG: hypothetical protein DMG70_11185 [Acidobacteriota bacterium]
MERPSIKPAGNGAIGVPAKELNSEVRNGLPAAAATIPEIRELYLFPRAFAREAEWSGDTVIRIDLRYCLPEARAREIVQKRGSSIQPVLATGESLDFAVLRENLAPKSEQTAS